MNKNFFAKTPAIQAMYVKYAQTYANFLKSNFQQMKQLAKEKKFPEFNDSLDSFKKLVEFAPFEVQPLINTISIQCDKWKKQALDIHAPNYKYPSDKKEDYIKKYPIFSNYLQTGISTLLQNEEIRNGLKTTGKFNDKQIDEFLAKWDAGVEIEIVELCPDPTCDSGDLERNGYTQAYNRQGADGVFKLVNVVQLDEDLVIALENAKPEEQQARLLAVISTLLHETTHQGDKTYNIPKNKYNTQNGTWERKYNPQKRIFEYYHNGIFIGTETETGRAFETGIWHQDNSFSFEYDGNKQRKKGLKDQLDLINKNTLNNNESVIPKIE